MKGLGSIRSLLITLTQVLFSNLDLLALDEKRVDNIVSVKVWSNVLDAPGRSLSMREILVFVSLGPLTHPKQQSPISATFYTELE